MDEDAMKQHLRQHSTPGKLRRLGQLRPGYHVGFRPAGMPGATLIEILPFKKHWPAILILAVVCLGLAVPLVNLPLNPGGADNLFDLTTSLFTLFWALGWSAGILIALGILLALLFARERIIVSPDMIRLRLEIFGYGLESQNPLSRLSHLRFEESSTEKGSQWRGGHLAIDYLGVPVRFGCNLDRQEGVALMKNINAALSHPVPEALADETMAAAKAEAASHADAAATMAEGALADATVAPLTLSESSSGRLSFWLLIGANLVPLFGAMLLGWHIGDIMLLFWLESAIVGIFNILKMFRIAGPVAIFYSLFFIGHFGAFMAVHLMFVFALFIAEPGQSASLAEVATIFRHLWVAIVALVISHAFSYVENFLGKQEYRTTRIGTQMHQPYTRIITMHVTLIIGGFVVMALDAPVLALGLLIVLKTAADARAHTKAHRRG